MSVIKVKENESIEQALRRFKKACEKAGILTELRRREYYDKPSIRKKEESGCCPQACHQEDEAYGPLIGGRGSQGMR